MSKFLPAFLIFCFCLTAALSKAQADYYLWEDPKSELTITFPDTWAKISNQNSADILTIIAPDRGGKAQCVVRTYPDERFVIFPPRYGHAVQKIAVSIPFWKDYLSLYDVYDIGRVYDGGGLGRWIASYATAGYMKRNGTVMEPRRALMFASLYYKTLYVVECSTLEGAYAMWEPDFRSIIKSIDFKKIYNERKTGHYANFLREADLYFWSQTDSKGTVGYN
jgi:hypothetical protein